MDSSPCVFTNKFPLSLCVENVKYNIKTKLRNSTFLVAEENHSERLRVLKITKRYNERFPSAMLKYPYRSLVVVPQKNDNDIMICVMNVGDTIDEFSRSSKMDRQVYQDIANQLKKLHTEGFVHGDVKWSNIIQSKETRNFHLIDVDECFDYHDQRQTRVPYGTVGNCGPDADKGIVSYREDLYCFIKLFDTHDDHQLVKYYNSLTKPTHKVDWNLVQNLIC
jgi:serine/threonine protein kinase